MQHDTAHSCIKDEIKYCSFPRYWGEKRNHKGGSSSSAKHYEVKRGVLGGGNKTIPSPQLFYVRGERICPALYIDGGEKGLSENVRRYIEPRKTGQEIHFRPGGEKKR